MTLWDVEIKDGDGVVAALCDVGVNDVMEAVTWQS